MIEPLSTAPVGPSLHRFESLDAIRGICAILVMAMHSRFLTGVDFFPSAYLMVDIFFMMSGFVIAHAYEGKLLAGRYFSTFVWRRYLRLFPMWFIGISIGVGFILIFNHRAPDRLAPLAHYVAALAFVPAIGSDYLFPENSPGWSLFFELTINLIYGLFVRWLSLPLLVVLAACAGLMLIMAGLRAGSLEGGNMWAGAGVGAARAAYGFSIGVILSRVYSARVVGWRSPKQFWVMIAGLTALTTVAPSVSFRPLYDLIVTIVISPVVVWLGITARSGAYRLAEALGAISYPLYATHYAIMTTMFFVHGYLMHWRNPLLPIGSVVCLMLFLIGFAYLLGRYVDPAAQRLGARWVGLRQMRLPNP